MNAPHPVRASFLRLGEVLVSGKRSAARLTLRARTALRPKFGDVYVKLGLVSTPEKPRCRAHVAFWPPIARLWSKATETSASPRRMGAATSGSVCRRSWSEGVGDRQPLISGGRLDRTRRGIAGGRRNELVRLGRRSVTSSSSVSGMIANVDPRQVQRPAGRASTFQFSGGGPRRTAFGPPGGDVGGCGRANPGASIGAYAAYPRGYGPGASSPRGRPCAWEPGKRTRRTANGAPG